MHISETGRSGVPSGGEQYHLLRFTGECRLELEGETGEHLI